MPPINDEKEITVKDENYEETVHDQRVETMKFYLIQNEKEKLKKLLQAEGEDQVHTFILE